MNSVKIHDMVVEYDIIIRDVKYWRLEIKDEKLVLIMPHKDYDHQKMVLKHKKWIYKKFSEINSRREKAVHLKLELNGDESEFRDMIKVLVQKFSSELDVNVKKVYFKRMKSRWGSCSSRRNISINVYLNYLPPELVEYVVFHEVVHLVELNHSKKFWSIISSRYPHYKNLEDNLSIYWLKVKDRFLC